MSGTDVPMWYFSQGQIDQALLWTLNNYVFGILWILIGMAIFATVHKQSKSAAISGFIIAFFFAIINSQLPVEVQGYFTLLIGTLLFMVIYKVVR